MHALLEVGVILRIHHTGHCRFGTVWLWYQTKHCIHFWMPLPVETTLSNISVVRGSSKTLLLYIWILLL